MPKLLNDKRLMIDKTTRSMVAIVAVCSFIAIFAIFSGHTLLTIMSYQNRVINQQNIAYDKLKADINVSKQLNKDYDKFNNSSSTNLLGAPVSGSGQNSGDNAKIVLDALPSVYDFPALATSLQNLLSNQGVTIGGISASESSSSSDSTTSSSASATNIGQAISIPFSFDITGPYQNIQNVIGVFERSIRPFEIQSITLSGNDSSLSASVTAETFYQPGATFNISSETVK